MTVLSGDIGGTKTRLALLRRGESGLEIIREETYPSGDFSSLTHMVRLFLETCDGPPTEAGFGVAGPLRERSCRTTNLPWLIDADELETELGIPRVTLLNDLEAVAWGLPALTEEALLTLQQGTESPRGNRSVVAAGTGLGEAGLYWDGEEYRPFATEGGHCTLAPTTPLQFELLQYLQRTLSRATWEDVVSGPGLITLYRFLLQRSNVAPPGWFLSAESEGDAAAAIASRADAGQDPVAFDALQEFVRLLATEAGNLALKHMATGGLYIGGGIPPKILPWLQRPLFLETFCDKGKMRPLMDTIPVHVILDDRVALYGPMLFLEKNR